MEKKEKKKEEKSQHIMESLWTFIMHHKHVIKPLESNIQGFHYVHAKPCETTKGFIKCTALKIPSYDSGCLLEGVQSHHHGNSKQTSDLDLFLQIAAAFGDQH